MTNLKKNYAYNLIYQTLAIIMPVITTPYISRVLNVDGVGKYSYALSVVTILALFANAGSDAYSLRKIATVQDDKYKRSVLFYEILTLRIISTILVSAVYIIIIGLSNKEYQLIYLILIFNILSVPLSVSWFFQGLEDYKKTVVRDSICKIISFIMIILFVKRQSDVYIYALIMSLTIVIGNLSIWFYLPKYLVKVALKKLSIKQHILPSLELFLPFILINIYTTTNKIILGRMTTETEVGYFTQSDKVVRLIMTVITSLGTVMIPRIANMINLNETDKIRKLLYNALRFTIMLGLPITAGVFLISDIFIPFFLGSGYEKCIILLRILSPIIMFVGIASVTGQTVLISAGKQREYTASILFGAIISTILNLILIPKLSSVGASITILLTEGFITITQFYYVNKLVHFSPKEIFKENYKYLVSSFIMGAVLIAIHNYFNSSVLSIIAFVSIGGLIYFILLYTLKDSTMRSILKNKFKLYNS